MKEQLSISILAHLWITHATPFAFKFRLFQRAKTKLCWPFCCSTCHISNVNVWTELSLIVKSQWFAAQKGKSVFRVKLCYYGESENSEKSENLRILLQILYHSIVKDLWPINFVQETIFIMTRGNHFCYSLFGCSRLVEFSGLQKKISLLELMLLGVFK